MSSSPTKLFGTDGIRGPAGRPPLDRESLLRLGRALGKLLGSETPSPSAILAGDTRRSTPDICSWLSQGLEESGCATLYGGVLPTPAVSRLAETRAATVGIAVSASHNPSPDNGVKLLDGSGFKWARQREVELERLFDQEPRVGPLETASEGNSRQSLEPVPELREEYLSALTALFPPSVLDGVSVVLDMAHGAATGLASEFFAGLGASIAELGNHPDGSNINQDCGSTHPELAIRETMDRGADLGFAFDGDADRALAIDETGTLHDGDSMLYALATWLRHQGDLEPPRLVATSMSNLGLETALERRGIGLTRCDVGDRAVVETLRAQGLLLGGEQSGHIVHLGLSSTGDGLLSAALVARAVKAMATPLSELTAGFRRFPQILRNIPVPRKPEFQTLPRVMTEAGRIEEHLGSQGRLVLRYSGTEPLARVMIEGPDQKEIEQLAEGLAVTISREIERLEESAVTRLSVNVDHVATLREVRGAVYPDVLEAAALAEASGADGITVHLRYDRRHIQDSDISALRLAVRGKLNLEMSVEPEMVAIAIDTRPDQVTLVPERPEEVTTEGGLDLLHRVADVERAARALTSAGISVSLFLDPDPEQVRVAADLIDMVDGFEINTDSYSSGTATGAAADLERIARCSRLGAQAGLAVYAGHGLTSANVGPIAAVPEIEELNIGHALISRAVFVGLPAAVREMLAAIGEPPGRPPDPKKPAP